MRQQQPRIRIKMQRYLVFALCLLGLLPPISSLAGQRSLSPQELAQGQRWLQQGRYQQAIEVFEKAIRLDPAADAIYHNLAFAYRKINQYDKSLSAYRAAIRLDPGYAPSYYGMGLTYNLMGKYQEAISPLQTAIRLDPKSDASYHNLGLAYRESGQYTKAIGAYEHATRLDPSYAPSHFGLGFSHWKLGRDEQAIAAFKKAIELQSDHAAAHYNLGLAYRRSGRLPEALEVLKQFVALAKNQAEQKSWVSQAQELIAKLEVRRSARPDPPSPLTLHITSHDTSRPEAVAADTSNVVIRGYLEHAHPDAKVTVHGKFVGVDASGRFAGAVKLTRGDNRIVIVARAPERQVIRRTVTIHRPLDPKPIVTSEPRPNLLALVIGNSAYRVGHLPNPVNDATDVAAILKRLGFTVTLLLNAEKQAMDRAVKAFTAKTVQNRISIFYYAGHGMQIDGVNYLIPIEAQIESGADVKRWGLPAAWVLERMEEVRNRLNVIILDACRDNPFRAYRSWGAGRGLAPAVVPVESLIAYATAPGSVAEDGTGRNSPFTKHLLQHITDPTLKVEDVFKQVGHAVVLETAGKQVPWISSSVHKDFYLANMIKRVNSQRDSRARPYR